MTDTIKIFGSEVKKKNAIIGGVVIGGFGILYYIRQKKAAAAAAQAAADTAAGQADGSNVDPQTGYPYGSPEDQAALAAMSGGILPTYGGNYGGGSFNTNECVDQAGNAYPCGSTPPGTIQTNAQWAQAAESLMGSNGADAIAAALGKYLTGAQITNDQLTNVQEAIGAEGYPPVPGPDGYPPSYHLATGPPGGGNATNPVTGLHVTNEGFTGSDISWNASPGATGYQVTSVKGTVEMTGKTSARIHNIGPSHSQSTVRVLATPAASGAQDASVVVHVK